MPEDRARKNKARGGALEPILRGSGAFRQLTNPVFRMKV